MNQLKNISKLTNINLAELIIDGLKDIVKKILEKSPNASVEQIKNQIIELNSEFKNYPIFNGMIDVIHSIVKMEQQINTTKSSGRSPLKKD